MEMHKTQEQGQSPKVPTEKEEQWQLRIDEVGIKESCTMFRCQAMQLFLQVLVNGVSAGDFIFVIPSIVLVFYL